MCQSAKEERSLRFQSSNGNVKSKSCSSSKKVIHCCVHLLRTGRWRERWLDIYNDVRYMESEKKPPLILVYALRFFVFFTGFMRPRALLWLLLHWEWCVQPLLSITSMHFSSWHDISRQGLGWGGGGRGVKALMNTASGYAPALMRLLNCYYEVNSTWQLGYISRNLLLVSSLVNMGMGSTSYCCGLLRCSYWDLRDIMVPGSFGWRDLGCERE